MLMPTVERYMTREPYSLDAGDNLSRAKLLMQTHRIRHLPVVAGDQLVGVVSERCVELVEAVPGVNLEHVEVARVMEPALTAKGGETIDAVSAKMAEHRRDCVVVCSGRGVTGVFTAMDALDALADIARRATA